MKTQNRVIDGVKMFSDDVKIGDEVELIYKPNINGGKVSAEKAGTSTSWWNPSNVGRGKVISWFAPNSNDFKILKVEVIVEFGGKS